MQEPLSGSAIKSSSSAVEEVPLFFTSAGHTLYGVFHAPHHERKKPVVIFCHSLGIEHMVTQRMEALAARNAAAAGFAAFRYHSRAHGDSSGNPATVTFAELVDDACAAADYARKLCGAVQVIWIGVRFGCLTAAEAMARRRDAAALALWEPIHQGNEYFRSAVRAMSFCQLAQGKRSARTVDQQLKQLDTDGMLPVIGAHLHRALRCSAEQVDLERSLLNWHGNTLIAQVQRRPRLSASNQRACSLIEQRGGKVTVALINQEPAWSMLPLVQPQWTSKSMLASTAEWLHGLE